MEDIRLSKNFLLSELIKSDVAIRHGINNYPTSPAIIENLRRVATKILQPCRDKFGAIRPSSGYRNAEVNRLAGSKAKNSQHLIGQAVDFEVPGIPNHKLACWIRDNIPVYDQIILEFYRKSEPSSGWVHVSIKDSGNRMQCLTTPDGRNYFEGLQE